VRNDKAANHFRSGLKEIVRAKFNAQGAMNDEDTLAGCRAGIRSRYAANAGITPAPVGKTDSLVTKVAEGCGPGFWRGPNGRCHPMYNGRACPPGYHLGPERKRCWPNE
jgi:hypothetical protein